MSDPELIRNALRQHVNALAVDIGPRTPLNGDSLVRAAEYIHSVFEDAGLSVREQNYQYYDQRVTNVLATHRTATGASTYYVVGAHYDTVPGTPGADDNASAVAVMLELAQRLSHERLKAPVLFAAFTLEEPPAYLTGHQGSRSDHASFWDARFPALMVTDTAFFRNPNYHLPSDTIDTLDFTFMAELVKSLELALSELPPHTTSS